MRESYKNGKRIRYLSEQAAGKFNVRLNASFPIPFVSACCESEAANTQSGRLAGTQAGRLVGCCCLPHG
jgi:hypothetical protein